MTAGVTSAATHDSLATLREYAELAPWNLRDLAALAGAILDASGVYPVNAAARTLPAERTIRFYVGRGLVTPPEGRGTAAIYSYRHLLEILAIKLRQMEGSTLDAIVKEFAGLAGDGIERRVAAALGSGLPAPARLQMPPASGEPRGKVGQARQVWLGGGQDSSTGPAHGRMCRRLPLAPGVELLVDDRHPLFRFRGEEGAVLGPLRQVLANLAAEAGPDR